MAGNGSSASPWEITLPSELADLAAYVNAGNGTATNGAYYKLMNAINLSGYPNWDPIGNFNDPFEGNFDGNNKVISNLTINRPGTDYQGLFGCIFQGNIQNLGIENCNIIGQNNVGGLVGQGICTFTNCYTTGNVTGNSHMGGLAGFFWVYTMTNCYTTCTVTGMGYESYYVGGLVGSGGKIANCYATGAVTGNGRVGGLAGMTSSDDTIRNCYATGNVTGNRQVGGLVGYISDGRASIRDSYATGNVKGNDTVGGLVGHILGSSIRNSYAFGCKTEATKGINVGRVVGLHSLGPLSNNYAYDQMELWANGSQITTLAPSPTPNNIHGGDILYANAITQATYPATWFPAIDPPWTFVYSPNYNIKQGTNLPILTVFNKTDFPNALQGPQVKENCSLQTSASFYANDIYYLNLPDTLFCLSNIDFHAEIEGLNPIEGSLKWYIDGVEEVSVRDSLDWSKNFVAGKYDIRMWVRFENDDTISIASTLNIGAVITAFPAPPAGGIVTGDGCFWVGDMVNLLATANTGYHFTNWTEGGAVVHPNASYSFTAAEDRTLIANFEQDDEPPKRYIVTIMINEPDYGYATGAGTYDENDTATVLAFPYPCYRFADWTIDSVVVSTDTVYSFIVTKDVDLLASFYGLDFDAYAVTICDKIFLLNLKKLTEDGYEVVGCKWFKNGIEVTDTHTQSEFSYSEGDDKLLEPAPTEYMFQLITNSHGALCSSNKIIIRSKASHCITANETGNLIVYPNPVLSGSPLTIEGNIKGSPIFVYNHLGACVHSSIAGDHIITLTLQLSQGIYLIRTNDHTVKIIITN
jgi:hypothetical protein